MAKTKSITNSFNSGASVTNHLHTTFAPQVEEPDYSLEGPEKLLQAFSDLQEVLQEESSLDETLRNHHGLLHYLCAHTGLKRIQVIVVTILLENGMAMTLKDLGRALGTTHINMLAYHADLELLVTEKRWCEHMTRISDCQRKTYYHLVPGVTEALALGQTFVPQDLSGLTAQQFILRISHRFTLGSRNFYSFEDAEEWWRHLVRQNPQLRICQVCSAIGEVMHADTLLLLFLCDYYSHGAKGDWGIDLERLRIGTVNDEVEAEEIFQAFQIGTMPLVLEDYIEPCCVDGLVDISRFRLSPKGIALLEGMGPIPSILDIETSECSNLFSWQRIVPRPLYYNDDVQSEVNRLHDILSQQGLTNVQYRLQQLHMHKGIAILLQGGPGTGKTELVKQLALESQRDLYQVDLSSVRDKYVGESEKHVQSIFTSYRDVCRRATSMPILFLNECDALLGKRSENAEHSVDKMENAMQNILLQALEDFEGVAILTTNLVSNLDPAFERRLLMRIHVGNPNTTTRARILGSMLPTLSESDINELALRYPLTGGQIENVARLLTIEHVISGSTITRQMVESFCQQESCAIQPKRIPILGFH